MNARTLVAKCLRRCAPALPASWQLPYRLWLHLRFEDAAPELVHLEKLIPCDGVAIDAGANIGLYSLALARLCRNVYAFEINELTSQPLKDCARPNIEIINVGLSNRAGEATLYTPLQPNGIALDAWASLQPGNAPGIKRHHETRVKIQPLDAFAFPQCDFLKIDVEGHELELLEGALGTLRRTRPIMLVEVRDRNLAPVTALLEPLGYQRTSIREILGIPSNSENIIFLPLKPKEQIYVDGRPSPTVAPFQN
jgi:FkbM family methyltransferase